MLQIINAIENRLVLKFKYNKETTYRNVDVYVLGLNDKGEALIRAYELPSKGWKLFKVADMNDMTVTSTKLSGHKYGYSFPDKAFKKVVKKVK
jgi:hypothetical protein